MTTTLWGRGVKKKAVAREEIDVSLPEVNLMAQQNNQQYATRAAEGSLEMGSSNCWTWPITQPNTDERTSKLSLNIRLLDFAAQRPAIDYSPYHVSRTHFSYDLYHWNGDLLTPQSNCICILDARNCLLPDFCSS